MRDFRFPALVLSLTVALLTAGCMPQLAPDPKSKSRLFFPYVRNDTKYTSWVNVFNRSTYWTPALVRYRNPAGSIVAEEPRLMGPHETLRLNRSSFTGSVEIEAWAEYAALQGNLEMRENAGKGVALSEKATNDYIWFWHLGVKDEGPGKSRGTIVTANQRNDVPIYVEYAILQDLPDGASCPNSFEVKIPPGGLHMFQPYDKFPDVATGEETIFVGANTGPNRSGQAELAFTGTVFQETPTDIALTNYKNTNLLYWNKGSTPATQENQIYFADVQDDGVSRTDRIYVKTNEASGKTHAFPIHFYDEAGTEILTLHPPLSLVETFDDFGSYKVLRPMQDFLGKAFKGSVWIESPHPLKGAVRRVSPGKWTDLCDASPASSKVTCCVPYVTSNDANWVYQIVLFYPASIYTPPEPVAGPPTADPVRRVGPRPSQLHRRDGPPEVPRHYRHARRLARGGDEGQRDEVPSDRQHREYLLQSALRGQRRAHTARRHAARGVEREQSMPRFNRHLVQRPVLAGRWTTSLGAGSICSRSSSELSSGMKWPV
ncbi:MAG: hypothetical protein JXQ73_22280 [Phycisphaerae bacterium]|nr:hypothetical protein [Phycisphaerae bacterium]